MDKIPKIGLKEFLKKYTGVSIKFINEYYKFYEMCETTKYGINVEDVINYLEIKQTDKFYSNIRTKYIVNVDYIKRETQGKKNSKSKDNELLLRFKYI